MQGVWFREGAGGWERVFSFVYGFDANTGRVTQFQFTAGATPKSLTGVPGWNANGTLGTLAITDQFKATDTETCSYVHDDLARIQSVKCVNAAKKTVWTQDFTLDPFGNISKSGTSSFAATYLLANGSTNNREQTVSTCVPTYDSNGNLTKDCVNNDAYAWDAEGNPTSLNGVGLTYDAFGREVEKALGTTHTEILYGPLGKLGLMNGQVAKTIRISLPGGSTAELDGATGTIKHTLHADWLGSSRLSTNYVARTEAYDTSYAPFGENPGAANAELNFTGQSEDTLAGLYDFLYRKYSPVHGRWLSPDPSGLAAVNPGDPQTWNRYAYVRNSPLNSTDPLGLDCLEDGDCGGDPCGDYGCDPGPGDPGCCDGGGGGGTLNIDWGPRGVNAGPSGFLPCTGQTQGVPCGLSFPTDPNFNRALAALAAALKGNWQGALGAAIAGPSQGLGGAGVPCDFLACGIYAGGGGMGVLESSTPTGEGTPDSPWTFYVDVWDSPPQQWKPARQPSALSKYLAFLGCEGVSVSRTITDQEDGQGWTAYGFINAGAILAIRYKQANLIGLTFVATAGAMDLGAMVKANQECTALIYH